MHEHNVVYQWALFAKEFEAALLVLPEIYQLHKLLVSVLRIGLSPVISNAHERCDSDDQVLIDVFGAAWQE